MFEVFLNFFIDNFWNFFQIISSLKSIWDKNFEGGVFFGCFYKLIFVKTEHWQFSPEIFFYFVGSSTIQYDFDVFSVLKWNLTAD